MVEVRKSVLECAVLECAGSAAVCCSVLQYAAVCCSVLQCTAVCYSALHCASLRCSGFIALQWLPGYTLHLFALSRFEVRQMSQKRPVYVKRDLCT